MLASCCSVLITKSFNCCKGNFHLLKVQQCVVVLIHHKADTVKCIISLNTLKVPCFLKMVYLIQIKLTIEPTQAPTLPSCFLMGDAMRVRRKSSVYFPFTLKQELARRCKKIFLLWFIRLCDFVGRMSKSNKPSF